MIRSDPPHTGAAQDAPHPRPAPGAAQPGDGSEADALRGLASVGDPPSSASMGSAPRLSLWARIKRAFQYGSQGREDG